MQESETADKLAKTGMVLGKFMPIHKGHQYLIDYAKARVEDLVVIVGTISREPIPGYLRFGWVKELYPDVKVLHLADELPQEPREHPEFWEMWTRALRRLLPTGPDLVFSSEDYGDELARRLGARHIKVDQERKFVPISATKIRQDPFAHWQYIPECVRPYFVKRVVVYGSESTGKTTLARRLAEHYQTVWVPEYAQAYLEQKGAPIEREDIPQIARGQISSEEALARKAHKLLICDSDLTTTTIYSEYYFSDCPAWIYEEAARRSYDLYLLNHIDVPWVSAPHRDIPHFREEMHRIFQARLQAKGVRYVDIRGSWEERFQAACRAIDTLFAS